MIVREARWLQLDLHAEGHLLESGGEDWPDAFRHKPILPSQANLVITAVATEEGEVLFQESHSCIFGLAGSVTVYNRHPLIHKSLMRRCARVPTEMYVDDESLVDFAKAMGAGQQLVEAVAAGAGSPFAEKKKLPMAGVNKFLGVNHDLRQALSHGIVKFKVMDETFDKGEALLKQAEDAEFLGPGASAKVRGVYGWCARELVGNIVRGGNGPLIARQ